MSAGKGWKAKVLYSYEAAADDELSLDVGDIVTAVESFENGWTKVVPASGVAGLFPTSYLETVSKPSPAPVRTLSPPAEQSAAPAAPRSPVQPQLSVAAPPVVAHSPQPQPQQARAATSPTPTPQPSVRAVSPMPTPQPSVAAAAAVPTISAEKRRAIIAAKLPKGNSAQNQKILEAIVADKENRMHKIEAAVDDLDQTGRRDFGDLSRTMQKYAASLQAAIQDGNRVTAELARLAERNKDSQTGSRFQRLAADLKAIQDSHDRWQKQLQDVVQAPKELEVEAKQYQGFQKKIRDANKKFESHIKEQFEVVQLYSPGEAAKVMSELSLQMKEIGSARDQMLSSAAEAHAALLHKGAVICAKVLAGYASATQAVDLSASTAIAAETVEPLTLSAWEQYQLREIPLPSALLADALSSQEKLDKSSGPVISGPILLSAPPRARAYSANPDAIAESTVTIPDNSDKLQATIVSPSAKSASATVVASTPSPASSDWEEYFTDDGTPYYYNPSTGETVWDKP